MASSSGEGRAAVVVGVSVLVAVAVGGPAGLGGVRLGPVPLLWVCVALAFSVQWLAFIPAFKHQTERFFDLTGSATYLAVMALSLLAGHGVANAGPAQWLVTACVCIWALRLGTFLFKRVHEDGGDGRFDDIKPNAARFFSVWTLQGLWVSLTALSALAVNTSPHTDAAPVPLALGAVVWAAGFGTEVVADAQKRAFRRNPAHAGRWISTGLWARCQHPNYLGEIVAWWGIFIMSTSVVTGGGWLGVVSPLFVYALLTRVSGVPLLQARAFARWGAEPEFRRYRQEVPLLLPVGRFESRHRAASRTV